MCVANDKQRPTLHLAQNVADVETRNSDHDHLRATHEDDCRNCGREAELNVTEEESRQYECDAHHCPDEGDQQPRYDRDSQGQIRERQDRADCERKPTPEVEARTASCATTVLDHHPGLSEP